MMKAIDDNSAILHHWCEIGLQQLGLDMVHLKLIDYELICKLLQKF